MKFPDDETLRRLREMERMMPPEGERRRMEQLIQASTMADKQMLKQMQQLALDNSTRQARLAMENIGRMALEEQRRIADQVRDIARVVTPSIQKHMAELAASVINPMRESYQNAAIRIAQEVAGILQSARSQAIAQAIENIQTLTRSNDASIRLALETVRNLQLDIAPPAFTNFVEESLKQPGPLTKKRIQKISKAHLSKKKVSGLSKEQQFNLMAALTVLSLLVSIYSAFKPSQPIKIDADQFSQLSRPQININNIWQVISPPADPVYYLVMRDCELTTRPNNKSTVIIKLSPGGKVRLLLTSHQWIYVRDETLNKEGWVKKKYLKKLN